MSTIDKKEVTIAEARKFLEEDLEGLDPLQRRVHDYAVRFSKIPVEKAEALATELVNDVGLELNIAVQITNCIPTSVGELRTILGRRKIISEEDINSILEIIKKYKSD